MTPTLTADDAERIKTLLDSGTLDALLDVKARTKLRTAAQAAYNDAGGPPIACVVAVTRGRRGVRTVAVACPFCPPTPRGKPHTHIHGWPDDEPQPGVRVAHCEGGARRDYRIELPASAAVAS